MDLNNLVHMANRIGQFFDAMPDRAEAKAGIADHIRKFWAPRMRSALLSQLDSDAAAPLLPIVREALTEQRAALMPG